MPWWPGWNSIEATEWHAHLWFWLGIVFLVALAIAEVISHLYGLRKDALIGAHNEENGKKQKEEEEKYKATVSSLERQLEDLKKRSRSLKNFRHNAD